MHFLQDRKVPHTRQPTVTLTIRPRSHSAKENFALLLSRATCVVALLRGRATCVVALLGGRAKAGAGSAIFSEQMTHLKQ